MVKNTVLSTGAGSGIGLATARKYIQAGNNVALLSYTKEKMVAGVKDLDDQFGDNIFFWQTDISDSHAVDEAVQAIVDHVGGLELEALGLFELSMAFQKQLPHGRRLPNR